MKETKRIYNWDTFFKLDFEIQKYIFSNGNVQDNVVEYKIVDNDKIFAIFLNTKRLVFTNTHFFVRSKNSNYVVYDKVTKKVRSTLNKNFNLSEHFLNYFFNNKLIISQLSLPQQMSKTFVKRVIENKICTIKDVFNYLRSYVYRNKNIPDQVLLNFSCIKGHVLSSYSPFIKNWDLFLDITNCRKLFLLNIEGLKCLNYKIQTEDDLSNLKLVLQYENWKNKIGQEINRQ